MADSTLHNFLRNLMLPLKQMDEALPAKGTILDLGCAEGPIAFYLAKNPKRFVIGVDLDAKRLPKSKQKNLIFEKGDIRKYSMKNVSAVVISDVLHHIEFKDQELVLKNVAEGLKKDGILLIKEIDTEDTIRSKLSRFWDFVFYPNEKIYFSSKTNLKNKLSKLGFKTVVKKDLLFFPGSTTLYVCKK